MSFRWRREAAPSWAGDLKRIVGGQPAGVFDVEGYVDGQPMIGEWWSVSGDDGAVLGYGWLDATWGGDAEVSVAVDPNAQQQGVGSFIMSGLEREAAARGFNYVYNSIRPSHPNGSDLYDWLAVRGYTGRSHYDQIAQDTLAMALNDIITVGATRLIQQASWPAPDTMGRHA